MKTITYKQLKRLVAEAKREEMTVPDDHVFDLDKIRSGGVESLQKMLESLHGGKANLDEIEVLHKELSKITLEKLHDRADAKNEIADGKSHERDTNFVDKAVKEFGDMAGVDGHGDRLFFKVQDNFEGCAEELGVVIQRTNQPYKDSKRYTALFELFEDEEIMKKYPLLATIGAGIKTTLNSACQTAKECGLPIPDKETKWTASMYTRRDGKFSRINEGFRSWVSNAWKRFSGWFAERFMPRYKREVVEFEDELLEANEVVTRIRKTIAECEYDFQGQSAMLQESRRRRALRRLGRR